LQGSIRVVAVRKLAFGGITGVCSLITVTLLIAYGSAPAATLMLKDGSVIHGDIKTLKDDVYTVETDSLGTVHVRKQDIRTIDHSDGSTIGSPVESSTLGSPPEQAELQAMQSSMMQSPNLFSMIQALQSDPDVQAVLSDPEIMNAMASGDYTTLMNHPKIIALTSNANVREVIDEVH